jgi:C4-type Zn-finger protein
MECRKCHRTALKKIEKKYIVHLPYRGKIESYQTNLQLYYCLNCGYEWWDSSLPDPIEAAILQYVALHGREDSESKHLIKRFALDP